jgi:branched-chain amino acid transport system substrate-binding protein
VARQLSRDGFGAIVNYAGKAAVVAEIAASGARAIAVKAAVASAPDVDRLFYAGPQPARFVATTGLIAYELIRLSRPVIPETSRFATQPTVAHPVHGLEPLNSFQEVSMHGTKTGRSWLALSILATALWAGPAGAADPVKIGLVAALSGQSAASGEAITRGLTVAIDEINTKGGVLGGRMLELVRRDDESNPSKGVTAARELIFKEQVVALFGGIDSPVSLAVVPLANAEQKPFIGVWAAATGITRNGANPNYVFRVSAVDAIVDKGLLQYATKTYGAKKAGLMLINNPWGQSNQDGLNQAAAAQGIILAGVEKFQTEDIDMVPQLSRLKQAGADSIILVANAAPGAQVVRSLDRMGWAVPVISHWGISGGRFVELAGPSASKVPFVQTYSFFGGQSPRGQHVLELLMKRYPQVKGPADIIAPVGTANAYDAMHLLARAIQGAGSTEGPKVREAMYKIGRYEGLIKTYDPAFTADNHDALNENDYVMVHFTDQGEIIPVKGK